MCNIRCRTTLVLALSLMAFMLYASTADQTLYSPRASNSAAAPSALAYDGKADFAPLAGVAADNLGGYTSKVSVAPGDVVNFHVSTDVPNFSLTISRQAPNPAQLLVIPSLNTLPTSCAGRYDVGCDWPVVKTLTIPTDWQSGVYYAQFPTSSTPKTIIFFVRESNPGTDADFLLLSAINTSNAYTNFGGKSVYEFNSSDGIRGQKVSFDRLLRTDEFSRWERNLLDWSEGQGFKFAVAADYDLEFIPDLLDNYKVVVIAGHSEYWSWNMRQRLKAYINNGGRFINLSGNTMWQQVRFENNGRVMASYKDYRDDPIQDRESVTDNPIDYPILDTEGAILGGQWLTGGYIGPFTHANGFGGFSVLRTDHWVMDGTGVLPLDMIGRTNSEATAVIDKEADGVFFNCEADGQTILGPVVNNGTPENFTILGMALSSFNGDIGFIPMGLYTVPSGGAVFSVNTTGWTRALGADSALEKITHNVFSRFLDMSTSIPAEAPSADAKYLFRDRFNCYNVQENWPRLNVDDWKTLPVVNYTNYTSEEPFTLDPECGFDGSGLKISAIDNTKKVLISRVHSDWSAENTLYSSMYLDLGQLTISNNGKLEILRFSSDSLNAGVTSLAWLEVMRTNEDYAIRFVPKGTTPAWVPVPRSGKFLVETGWDKSTNQVTLWVDGVPSQQSSSLGTLPGINRVDMGFVTFGASVQGSYCMDEFAFDEERISYRFGEPEPTPVPTLEPTPIVTPTVVITITPTLTPTFTPTITPTVTPTVEVTLEPTFTPTTTPATIIVPTATMTVTAGPTVAETPMPTSTSTVDVTIEPTFTETPLPTVTPTATSVVQETPDGAATTTETPTPTISNWVTVTPTPTSTVEGPGVDNPIPTVEATVTGGGGPGPIGSTDKVKIYLPLIE